MALGRSNPCLVLVMWLVPHFVWAERFLVLDQEQQPITDAVLAVAGDSSPTDAIVVMDQIDKSFEPHVLVVNKGQSVAFPNSDRIRHHVYSFSAPNDFEIKLYSGQPSDPRIFEHSGVVVLGCNIHDRMKGYIYVADDDEVAVVTDQQGVASLETQAMSVSVWHPRLAEGDGKPLLIALNEQDEQGRWLLRLSLKPSQPEAKRGFRDRYR